MEDEEVPYEIVFGIQVDGEENIESVMSCLRSPDMQDLCEKLLLPARRQMAHEAISMETGNSPEFDAGAYSFLNALIAVIQE